MSLAQDVAKWIADVLDPFPDWLIVMVVSMLPVAELRGGIPLGILFLDMPWYTVYVLAVAANIAVVPVIWWVLGPMERLLRKLGFMDRFLTWLFERTRRKSSKHIETYEELGLFLFVALPLPGTGAWTGALIAYLFDLPRHKSLWIIGMAVAVAGIIVLALVGGGIGIFGGG